MTTTTSSIDLMVGERMVMSSDDDILVLTNWRVRLDQRGGGASRLVSIMLDAVASCALTTKSNPILLVLGAGAGVAVLAQGGDSRGLLLVTAVACVVGYFVTRRAVLTITSSGGSEIAVPARMGRDKLVQFINAIESERAKRLDPGIARQHSV